MLLANEVNVLIDVRDWPYSRLKDYHIDTLKVSLSEYGIEYEHFHSLGNPKPGRDAARTGDAAEFHRIYHEHLLLPPAQKDLENLRLLLDSDECSLALMCYCRKRAGCHVRLITDRLADNSSGDLEIVDLGE